MRRIPCLLAVDQDGSYQITYSGKAATSPHLRNWRIDRAQGQAGKGSMTNTIALYLGIVILGALGLDIFLNDGQALVFLVRKLVGFIDYVAFWR
jgi:hypothetical protein